MDQPKGGNNRHQFSKTSEIFQKLQIPSGIEDILDIKNGFHIFFKMSRCCTQHL